MFYETVHGLAPSGLLCVSGEYRRPGLSSESGWIANLARRLPSASQGEVWIGDDAAVVEAPSGVLLLAADTLVEGVHADFSLTEPSDMGWKALAVNLSDIAAMGGRALHCLVTVVVPQGREADLDSLYEGLEEAMQAFECPIVGGDLSGGPTLVVTVAITGTVDDEGPPPVLRSGARPGDSLFVTEPLGSASAGLRALRSGALRSRDLRAQASLSEETNIAWAINAHRRPVPRMAHGIAARHGSATAMIDVSDGLAIDLRRMADASGVGVVVDDLAVASGATDEDALFGGDDYELLIACSDPDRLEEEFKSAGLPSPTFIGRCTDSVGTYRLGEHELPMGGWEHQW